MNRSAGVFGAPSARPTGYLRPTWQEAVAEYLPRRWRGARCARWITRMPLIAVVTVNLAMSARLTNTAFIDEARAISFGRSLLLQWIVGGGAADQGLAPSGVPELYPVVAAGLDAVGGLHLARLISGVCVAVAVIALASAVTRATSSERVGLLAACAFAVTSPVVFVGALATPDAVGIALLAVAARAAVCGRSVGSAALTGVLLASAAAVAYVALLFVPAVLLTTLSAQTDGSPPRPGVASAPVRLGIAFTVAAGLICALVLGTGGEVRRGISVAFGSLTAQVAGSNAGALWVAAVMDMGLLVVLAVAGTVQVARTGAPRNAAAVCGLLLCGVGPPVIHLVTGGATSFSQHNAYAALLLAPMAGHALTVLSRQLFRSAPVVVVLVVALLPAFSRSDALFHQWSDVTVVMADIEAHPQPGTYLSVASDVFGYYSRDAVPGVRWEATSTLYARGPAAVRRAVAERRYQVIVVRSASTAGPDQDVLLGAVTLSADYEKDPLAQPAGPTRDEWLVYRLVNTLP